MLKGANSSEVITNVKEKIAGNSERLPEGVEIEPFLDRKNWWTELFQPFQPMKGINCVILYDTFLETCEADW